MGCGYVVADVPAHTWRQTIMSIRADAMMQPYREMLASLQWPAPGLVTVPPPHARASQLLKDVGQPTYLPVDDPVSEQSIRKMVAFLQGLQVEGQPFLPLPSGNTVTP